MKTHELIAAYQRLHDNLSELIEEGHLTVATEGQHIYTRLCDDLADLANAEPAPVNVLVALEGGFVTECSTDAPGVRLTVLDYGLPTVADFRNDPENADQIIGMESEDGTIREAYATTEEVDHDPTWVAEALRLINVPRQPPPLTHRPTPGPSVGVEV